MCAKCEVEFPSKAALQEHFDASPAHPSCRACGVGFESLASWAEVSDAVPYAMCEIGPVWLMRWDEP